MNKLDLLSRLRVQWKDCTKCGLCAGATNAVFGEGNPDAKIVFVGEAPGAEEDKSGRPFVGEAGQVLNTFLEAAGLNRTEDVYITNTVLGRPTVESLDPKTKMTYTENRVPSTAERNACRPRLLEELYIVDPYVIVTLGKSAVQSLLGKANSITAMRGNVYTLHMQGRHTEVRYAVLAMYHPAFLARSIDYVSKDGVWQQTSQDFALLTDTIDHLNRTYHGVDKDRTAEYKELHEQKENDED